MTPPVAVRLDGVTLLTDLSEHITPSGQSGLPVSPHLGDILTTLHDQVSQTTAGDTTPTFTENASESSGMEVAEFHDFTSSTTFGVTIAAHIAVLVVVIVCPSVVIIIVVIVCVWCNVM